MSWRVLLHAMAACALSAPQASLLPCPSALALHAAASRPAQLFPDLMPKIHASSHASVCPAPCQPASAPEDKRSAWWHRPACGCTAACQHGRGCMMRQSSVAAGCSTCTARPSRVWTLRGASRMPAGLERADAGQGSPTPCHAIPRPGPACPAAHAGAPALLPSLWMLVCVQERGGPGLSRIQGVWHC